jgi:hypothetical protein
MNNYKITFWGAILMAGILLGACAPAPSQADPTELALVVARTQTAIAVLNLATEVAAPDTVEPASTATQPALDEGATATPTIEPTLTATPTSSFPPQPADCTNLAKFEDETIQDNTSYSVNKTFTKTWTLRNTGTCTWTPDYQLVFVSGERMGAVESAPIDQTVLPNSTITIRVDLTSPGASGTYQGDFKLRSPGGETFGLGSNADKSFWVKIRVVETTSELNLGTPTWSDSFDTNSGFWPLGDDDQIGYKITDGKLVMTAFKAIGDQWRLNAKPAEKNLFLEAVFETGDQCSGKDSYGLIVRSRDDDGDSVYDSGYVAVISCDGMYRLYRMDNGTFVSLINWTASSEINAGKNQTNRVSILVQGTLIRVYANGSRLAQVSDGAHESGKWGLTIRTADTSNFSVSVSDVAYWALGE